MAPKKPMSALLCALAVLSVTHQATAQCTDDAGCGGAGVGVCVTGSPSVCRCAPQKGGTTCNQDCSTTCTATEACTHDGATEDCADCTSCTDMCVTENNAAECKACATLMPNCDTCTSAILCGTCADGYYGSGTATCTECMDDCDECDDGATCTKCTPNYALPGCTTCEAGFGGATCEKACTDDIANCVVCTKTATVECTECDVGHYLAAATTCTVCTASNCGKCDADPATCDTCKDGHYMDSADSTCKAIVCTDPDSCDDTGTASCDSGTPNKCTCKPGYTGNICETACSGNCTVCTDATTCTACRTNFKLEEDACVTCEAGKMGADCSTGIDCTATPSPCLNDGMCTEGALHTCDCAMGFTGSTCELVSCGSSTTAPCENEGTCIGTTYPNTCDCTDTGFTGLTCENGAGSVAPGIMSSILFLASGILVWLRLY